MMRIDGTSTLSVADVAPVVLEVEFDDAWAIGPSMFGGAIVAGCIKAAQAALDSAGLAVVESSTRFLAPTPPGAAAIAVRVIRTGRSYATVSCTVLSDG